MAEASGKPGAQASPVASAQPAAGPLAGVRVLDFSRVLAGPYCTMVLADLGAEVIKVERPGSGDETRTWGPPFAGGESGYFLAVNRGKRSLALDLADPRSAPSVRALVARADVVIENFRAGVSERLGLDHAAVRALNERVVHCSITGYGSDREPAGRAGYDFTVQAESGLMSITGEPGGTPMKVGVAVIDVLCGLHAATGVVAALHDRGATGHGRHLEVSLLDAALAGLVNVAQGALLTGQEAGRHGNAHPSIVPYEPFAAADGWIAVAAANDSLWRALCAACERPDLAADQRFATNPERVAHREALREELSLTFATRAVTEWVARLDAHGVPAGKIRGVGEALAAAAQAGRPATVTVEHPTAGALELVRSPIRLEPPAAHPPAAPPRLGEHTLAVLREAGLDGEALVAAGVAQAAEPSVAQSAGR